MLKTFPKGGIHPSENKLTANKAIETLGLAQQVYIPITQHLGSPSEPIVSKGDNVKVGQLIAKSTSYVSANIHSSVSGTISKIDKVIDASGYKQTCIIIDVVGDDWLESIDTSTTLNSNFEQFSVEQIKEKIISSGIVGMGGATFPTHVKLSIPAGKTCDYLIINAVECEPYLTSDHRLMLEKPQEILIACKLIQKLVNAKKVIIGIENNKPDAISLLQNEAKKYTDIEIQGLKVKYPQGGEKQLIHALIKRQVPSGGLPIDVGAVVQNIGSCYAIYEAVMKNKPLIERIVTVTGNAVANPKNLKVRIGTPISHLIESVGGLPDNTGKIISGGPMMGKSLVNTSVPITKGSSGLVLLSESFAKRNKESNCIRCSKCASVCSMNLEPHLLKNMSKVKMYEELKSERILDCIECGSCSYVCPAHIPLLDYIRQGKSNLNKILRSKKS